MAAHHGEIAPITEEARLIPGCDTLSSQLPGIRHPEEPAFLSMVRQCEEVTRNHPDVISSWAHYAGNHIELVIRHTPMARTEALQKSLQELLAQADLRLPANITFLNKKPFQE